MIEVETIMNSDQDHFRWPRVSDAVVNRIVGMLRAGMTSIDLPTFEAFEADVARLFGVRHALCCNNGTAASFSAYRALGIGPGDTVIAPALTHWASVLPAVQCGAHIAFADTLPNSCHLDPEAVRRLIDATTRAVVVTHMFGEALAVDELRALCDAHGLALVEDVSHAHGATFQGRPVGSFGDVSFCSFQGQKLVSGGEGGALLTNSAELYHRALALGHPRRLAHAPAPWRDPADIGRGFKFRPSSLLVALAHDSLRNLDEQNSIRRRACAALRAALAESAEFVALERDSAGRVYYCCELYLRRQGERDRLVDALRARQVRAYHFVDFMPGHAALSGRERQSGPWPIARDAMSRVFCIEAFTAYSRSLVERYAQTIMDTIAAPEAV